MKAILCMDNTICEISNWFNFEDCKKFMLGQIPHKSYVVVDEKLFTVLEQLELTENYNMIVFKSKKSFENAINCKNYLELERQFKKLDKKAKVFLLGGSSVFKELLHFCDMATVGKFNKDLKNLEIADSPESLNYWFCVSKLNNANKNQILTYKNVQTFPIMFMKILYDLEQEDKKNKNPKKSQKVNAKTFDKTNVKTVPKPQHVDKPLVDVKTEQIMKKVTNRPSTQSVLEQKNLKGTQREEAKSLN